MTTTPQNTAPALETVTVGQFVLKSDPAFCRFAESIPGRMGIAHAFELASDYALSEFDPNAARWKIGLACQALEASLRKAGWQLEDLGELFYIVLPQHPCHPALLKTLAEMPKGDELKAHIEAGYLAAFMCNYKNAVPIQLSH